LVVYNEGGTQAEGFRKLRAEEDIWTKQGEITEEWRELHNEELLCFVLLIKYHSGDHIKKNEMGGACSTYG
jgi:hypothetical protein